MTGAEHAGTLPPMTSTAVSGLMVAPQGRRRGRAESGPRIYCAGRPARAIADESGALSCSACGAELGALVDVAPHAFAVPPSPDEPGGGRGSSPSEGG